ncbi:Uncharacterised protein [Citrobacter koseri]|nr:Uncharacterised protein [Citrobacter koseri]
MTTHDRVRQQLHALEALLREHHHWRMDEPQATCLPARNLFVWIRWNRLNGCNGC